MLTFLGENYFIDLEELESRVNLSKDYIPSGESEQQISVVKYDIYKNLIEVILTEREEMDENLVIHNFPRTKYKNVQYNLTSLINLKFWIHLKPQYKDVFPQYRLYS